MCLDKSKVIAKGYGVHWLTGDTSFSYLGVWIKQPGLEFYSF